MSCNVPKIARIGLNFGFFNKKKIWINKVAMVTKLYYAFFARGNSGTRYNAKLAKKLFSVQKLSLCSTYMCFLHFIRKQNVNFTKYVFEVFRYNYITIYTIIIKKCKI